MRIFEQLVLSTILVASTIAMAGAVAYLAFLSFEPDRMRYVLRGIDVSHHQGPIDWAAVKASGIDFVYMKATEGGDFKDRRFDANWAGAGRAELLRGAYHFFTLCRPGVDQAANFIDSVPREAGSLPPAVDLEFGGNCGGRPSVEALAAELEDFLDRIESHYGQVPVLYSTRVFYEQYLKGRFNRYGLWLRSLIFEPSYAERPWLFWQFHNRGRRPGIDGPVDLNVFRYDREALTPLLAAGSPEDLFP